MADCSSRSAPLHELLDRWEDCRSRGQQLSPEELCRDAPELLDAVRKHIGALQKVDVLLAGELVANRSASKMCAWQPGDVIEDLYEIRQVHEGGMGRVYRAWHRGWNVDLALKCPRPEYFRTERDRDNF